MLRKECLNLQQDCILWITGISRPAVDHEDNTVELGENAKLLEVSQLTVKARHRPDKDRTDRA